MSQVVHWTNKLESKILIFPHLTECLVCWSQTSALRTHKLQPTGGPPCANADSQTKKNHLLLKK